MATLDGTTTAGVTGIEPAFCPRVYPPLPGPCRGVLTSVIGSDCAHPLASGAGEGGRIGLLLEQALLFP